MKEQVNIALRSFLNPVAARLHAIERGREGSFDLNLLVRRFGIASLLELHCPQVTEFLDKRSHDNAFRDMLLSDLMIKPLRRRNVPPVEPGPSVIGWIGLIDQALRLEHTARHSRMTIDDWRRAEHFFQHMAYPEATDALLALLDSDIRFPTNVVDTKVRPISETVVGTKERTHDIPSDIPGGWQTVSCYNYSVSVDTYLVEQIEQVFPAYKPVAEGANAALMQIARKNPHLQERIFDAVLLAGTRHQFCSVIVDGKEIPGTRHYSDHYYSDY